MEHDDLFQSVGSKAKLVDRVVDNIQGLIIEGQLEPGTRLPPEREFADRMGVSRTVLREAVRILVTKGLLETRHGVGTVVRHVTSDQFLEPLTLLLQTAELSVEQLYQVRSILEVGVVRLAAKRALAEDLAELRTILHRMALGGGDTSAFVALDDSYHNALARATHNPLLVVLCDSIGAIMHEVRVQVHEHTELAQTALPDHLRILAALEAHDADRAAAAMQEHLDNARHFQREYLALGASQPYPDPLSI
jgi:GntR family transcriptional repressor for pyruvate dehydrogenase complex